MSRKGSSDKYLVSFPEYLHLQIQESRTSEEKEDEESLGKLFFSMKYSHEKNALVVSIRKCTNLPARDSADNSRLENRCEN